MHSSAACSHVQKQRTPELADDARADVHNGACGHGRAGVHGVRKRACATGGRQQRIPTRVPPRLGQVRVGGGVPLGSVYAVHDAAAGAHERQQRQVSQARRDGGGGGRRASTQHQGCGTTSTAAEQHSWHGAWHPAARRLTQKPGQPAGTSALGLHLYAPPLWAPLAHLMPRAARMSCMPQDIGPSFCTSAAYPRLTVTRQSAVSRAERIWFSCPLLQPPMPGPPAAGSPAAAAAAAAAPSAAASLTAAAAAVAASSSDAAAAAACCCCCSCSGCNS